jgi:hypothetical protein
MKAPFITVLLFLGMNQANAQDGWMRFPAKTADSSHADHVNLDYKTTKGKVTLHQDSRLDKLNEFVRSGENTVEGVKIDGYRIVIFFDQDRTIVAQQKANFLARYSGYKAYVDYVAPNYRVRVGNFRTQLEAEGFKAELLAYFPTSVVVADKIQLPDLPTQ